MPSGSFTSSTYDSALLLFERRIRHKVQGRLLPPRAVHSGVDMGRSTSVYFFCLAMDPIFVALHHVPRVLLVAGYVDDTTIVGQQSDPQWIKEVFAFIDSWSTAGVMMDAHTCWQVGLSTEPLPEQKLLRFEDISRAFLPWHEQGEPTVSRAIQHIPSHAHYFVLRHGEHCALFHTSQIHEWVQHGHYLLLQLAASPCSCRSKTQLLTSDAFTLAQLYQVDRAGLGSQCIVPATVNLGLTIHTGWSCGIQADQIEYCPLVRTAPSLLSKQLLKFRTRIAAGMKGNLSIHAKIIYFNAFSLSLFYYVQTHRHFPKQVLAPLYRTLADFLLKRHWFPQHKLVGICRWLPCVLCHGGANAIDHWLSYCPVVYGAWLLLWKGNSPPLDWRSIPNRQTGVALCYLLFHARRLVTEYGGLRPTIECLKLRTTQRHVIDLWQRVYQSLPTILLQWFRAPPLHQDLPCTNTTHIRVQRFPQTQIDSALLPDKGLCTNRAFRKHEVIATFGSSDVQLRLLLTQYRRLPFPAATAALLPYTCHCFFLHGYGRCVCREAQVTLNEFRVG